MADNVSSRVLDNGLTIPNTETTHIYICSTEPTTYTEATSTYALGNKNFGAGNAFGAPAAGSPNGRKVASTSLTGGSITTTGTAAKWAATDNTNSRLLACGSLASSQGVTASNTFSLASFDVRLPNQ